MTVRFSQDKGAASLAKPLSSSALVRRLLFRSHNDPAKRRILAWLVALDDARLLKLGLTPEDIAMLRTGARAQKN